MPVKDGEKIDTEYENDIRVIETEPDGGRPKYRFEAPTYKPKDSDNSPVWENPHKARMYAAVYVAVGTFREEKTGRRGIPIEVERDGREAVIAYLTTQDGMGIEWVTSMYDMDRQRVYEYRSRIKSRAEEYLIQGPE